MPSPGDGLALPQLADQLDRLLEHLQPDVGRGPDVAEHVLVECLAGPHARATNRPSSCTAAVAAAWAMTAGWIRTVGQVTAVVTGSEQAWEIAPIIAPDERALPLLVVPRVVVVADPEGLEAGLLGGDRLLDELGGRVLLAGQEVAEAHATGVPVTCGPQSAQPRHAHHVTPTGGTWTVRGPRVTGRP